MAQSVIKQIYDKINSLFGNEQQMFTMEFPGRVLNEATYGFETDTNYSNFSKPQVVIEEEFRLANDLFGFWEMTGGPNGEKLSDVYERVLNLLTPNYPQGNDLTFLKDKAKMRKWLEEEVIVSNQSEVNDNNDKGQDNFSFKGTRMQLYQYLNQRYQDALVEWKTEKNEKLKAAREASDADQKAKLMEEYANFVATVAPAKQAKLEALFAELVVRGYYHEVREILGYLDVKTDAELLEESKERLRSSKMSSVDESGTIYPVRFQPNDWFKELSTDFEPEDLLLNREFLQEQLFDKEVKLEQQKRQLARLSLLEVSAEQKATFEKSITTARNAYQTAENALLSKYSNATVSFLEQILGTDGTEDYKTKADEEFEATYGGTPKLMTDAEKVEFRRLCDEYKALLANGTTAANLITELPANAGAVDAYSNISDDAKTEIKALIGQEQKPTLVAFQKVYAQGHADNAAASDTNISTALTAHEGELVTKKKAEIAAKLAKEAKSSLSQGVRNKLAASVKSKLKLATFSAEDVGAIFKAQEEMQKAETELQNASRALLEIQRKAVEAASKDTALKRDMLEDEIALLTKEVERLRLITSREETTEVKGDGDLLPKTKKAQQRFMDVVMQFEESTMSRETKDESFASKSSVRTGFWFFSGSATHESSGSTHQEKLQEKSSKIGIGFKAMKVTIDRGGWFDPNIFRATKNMYKVRGGGTISAGTDGLWEKKKNNLTEYKKQLDSINEAIFPAYPVAFVVAKDITIKIDVKENMEETTKSVQESLTQGGAGVFCFSVSGSSSSGKSSESAYAHSEAGKIIIRIPTPQIIGWYIQPTPKDASTVYTEMPTGFLPTDTLSKSSLASRGLLSDSSDMGYGGAASRSIGESSSALATVVIVGTKKKAENAWFTFSRVNRNASAIFDYDYAQNDNAAPTLVGQSVLEAGHISERGQQYSSDLMGNNAPDYIIGHGGTEGMVSPADDYEMTEIRILNKTGMASTISVYHNGDTMENSTRMMVQVGAGEHEYLLSDLVQAPIFRNRKVSFVLAASNA